MFLVLNNLRLRPNSENIFLPALMLIKSMIIFNKWNFFQEENLPDISVWQLVKFNSKEWLALSIGILMCAITGLTMPLFSVFYSQIFIVSQLE